MNLLDSFLAHCHLQGLSPKTIRGFRWTLAILFRRFPDPFRISSPEMVTFFSHGKSHGFGSYKPASPSTYNNVRNSLNKFYRWAIDHGLANSNPITKIPRCKMPRRSPRRLTDEQKMRVLYHAQNYPHRSRFLRARNYAIVATLLMTGLRAQELLNLKNEDVRLQDQTIRIRHGKGDKERYVFCCNDLPPILRDYLRERDRLNKEPISFFASYRSSKGLRYKNLREIIVRIADRSNIPFTAHQLRHTCFSNMLEQNIDLGSIQAQAGHASLVSTQIYTQVADSVRREKIKKITFL